MFFLNILSPGFTHRLYMKMDVAMCDVAHWFVLELGEISKSY